MVDDLPAQPKPPTDPISARIPRSLNNALRAHAEHNGVGYSDVIQSAIQEYLDRNFYFPMKFVQEQGLIAALNEGDSPNLYRLAIDPMKEDTAVTVISRSLFSFADLRVSNFVRSRIERRLPTSFIIDFPSDMKPEHRANIKRSIASLVKGYEPLIFPKKVVANRLLSIYRWRFTPHIVGVFGDNIAAAGFLDHSYKIVGETMFIFKALNAIRGAQAQLLADAEFLRSASISTKNSFDVLEWYRKQRKP